MKQFNLFGFVITFGISISRNIQERVNIIIGLLPRLSLEINGHDDITLNKVTFDLCFHWLIFGISIKNYEY